MKYLFSISIIYFLIFGLTSFSAPTTVESNSQSSSTATLLGSVDSGGEATVHDVYETEPGLFTICGGLVVKRNGIKTFYFRSNRAIFDLEPWAFPQSWIDWESLKGKKVLDVGSGGGQLVMDLREICGVDAVGVDIALPENLKLPKFKDIFFEADAKKLPFSDQTFDFVYSIRSVFTYEENESLLTEFLAEMIRVSRIGGRIRIDETSEKMGNVSGMFSNVRVEKAIDVEGRSNKKVDIVRIN